MTTSTLLKCFHICVPYASDVQPAVRGGDVWGWDYCQTDTWCASHMDMTDTFPKSQASVRSTGFYMFSETPVYCLLENTRHVYYRWEFFISVFLPIHLYYHFTFLFYHYFLYIYIFFFIVFSFVSRFLCIFYLIILSMLVFCILFIYYLFSFVS